jgi:hypothetical protein
VNRVLRDASGQGRERASRITLQSMARAKREAEGATRDGGGARVDLLVVDFADAPRAEAVLSAADAAALRYTAPLNRSLVDLIREVLSRCCRGVVEVSSSEVTSR